MAYRIKKITIALIAAIMFFSLGINSFAASLTIKSCTIATGAKGIQPDAKITIRFSDDVYNALVRQNNQSHIRVLDSSGSEYRVYVYPGINASGNNDDNCITVIPITYYENGETYKLVIDKEVKGYKGGTLEQDTAYTFTISGTKKTVSNSTRRIDTTTAKTTTTAESTESTAAKTTAKSTAANVTTKPITTTSKATAPAPVVTTSTAKTETTTIQIIELSGEETTEETESTSDTTTDARYKDYYGDEDNGATTVELTPYFGTEQERSNTPLIICACVLGLSVVAAVVLLSRKKH